MNETAEPIYTLYPQEQPKVVAKILPGGEIELPEGMTLDDAIAALWADHAKNPRLADASFFAGVALLEVRRLFGVTSATKDADTE